MPATQLSPPDLVGSPPDLVESLKQEWRAGSPPDLPAALRDHPTLLRHPSLVLSLAFEAYAVQEEAGAAPDPEAFVRELPAYRSDVRGMLLDYRAIQANEELLKGFRFPEPGEEFEGCRVVRELGKGAFARAYLAVDPHTGGRRVVLKLSATASVEGETLGQVRHAHAAEVLWARKIGDGSAVCMPFGGAATLLDAVSAAFVNAPAPPTARTILGAIAEAGAGLPPPNDPVPPPLLRPGGSYADGIARIGVKLAGALAYLHGRGVTHGDLKPSNIVLAPGGHPYLIDFNLSGSAGEGHRYGGTLPYMSPERVRRFLNREAPAGNGPPADVYSFGTVLYEALTGRVPFPPLDDADLKVVAADQLRRQQVGAPRLVAVGVPRGLARLVERCLSADPSRRPTAAELERRLGRFVRRRVRRAVMVGVLVLAALAGAATWEAARPPNEADFIRRGYRGVNAGDWTGAFNDFAAAHDRRPEGRPLALMGYCRTKSGNAQEAEGFYALACDQHGYQEGWVLNNRAAGLIKTAPNSPEALTSALRFAEAAAAVAPDLQSAWYNRARARFLAHLDKKSWRVDDRTVLAAVEADLARLLREHPRVPYLHVLMAEVLAAPAWAGPSRLLEAVDHMRTARALQMPPATVADGPILRRLTKQKELADRLSQPMPTLQPVTVDLAVADPPAR